MKEKPIARDASIVSGKMLLQVVLSAVYITAICLCVRFVPAVQNLVGITAANYPGVDPLTIVLNSAVFATFMMAITFNGFNARTEHINVFEQIGRNKNFLLVMGGIFIAQFIFVTIGGDVLHVHPLIATTWLACAVLAFLVIVVGSVAKMISGKKKSE
jgi:magnesium-transporting ATPase (P-type)